MKSGETISNLSFTDLDGKTFRLEDLRGRWVILNFWSAECPWAERVEADLKNLAKAYGCALLTVAANANESDEQIKEAAFQRGLFPVLLDRGQQAADILGAETTPHIFLIDEKGVLRYQGAVDDVSFRQRTPTRSYLKDALEALKAGLEPDPADTPAYGCTIVRFHEGG